MAEQVTMEFFKNKKKQKLFIDKFAAKIILEDFFNYNLKNNEKEKN